MKNENRYSGSYFYIPLSVFKVGKGKRKLDYHIIIFHYGIGEWKTKGRYIQHVVVFRLSCFHLAKEKNENVYNGSYFYFSFFVWGLEKKKRMLNYPFSIFYYKIEKRKTKNERTEYTRTLHPVGCGCGWFWKRCIFDQFRHTFYHSRGAIIYCPVYGAFDLGLAVSVPLPIVTGIFVLLWFQSRLT